MNLPAPSSLSAPSCADRAIDGIDASCRVPFWILLPSAAFWLIVFSVFGLIASIKFHSPSFLADPAWLTFGRVLPAARNALMYGFAIPTALGVALWMFSRAGGRPAVKPWLLGAGAVIWNFGVLIGVLAILSGHSTGFEHLEMPFHAAVFLVTGYLLMGLCLLLTLYARQVRTLASSQWFLVAATFWFPWIYTTAMLLLTVIPVRGVTQAVIAWWFSANFAVVWIGLIGLAIAFDLIVRLTGRRLHSEYLGLMVFWTVLLFGSWTGIPPTAPVPAWIPTLSTIAAVLLVVPLLAIAMNLFETFRASTPAAVPLLRTVPGRFIGFGLGAFFISWLMVILAAVPAFAGVISMTWFNVGQWQTNLYAFLAMTLFGAVYHLVPRVIGAEWPRPAFVRAHFWLAAVGVVLMALPLEIGGVLQGTRINNPEIGFLQVARADLHFLRVSTIGELLLLLGHGLFLVNVLSLQTSLARARVVPFYRSAIETLEQVEVRS